MKGECKMSNNNKVVWLKRILAVKVILCFLLWGIPSLLAPLAIFPTLGAPMPDDPIYQSSLGAVVIAFGVAYWYAYKDPVHNIAIVKTGVVDNGLATLVTLYFVIFRDLKSIVMLVSGLLTLFFFVSFILFMPKTEVA
jgi:hypothetical protein